VCQTEDELLSLEAANQLKILKTNFEFLKHKIFELKECLAGVFKDFEDIQKEKEKSKEQCMEMFKEAEDVISQSIFG
jgi:tRNA U34 5-methylaminomethyl-2-thiouridine-forming methyltransferase MnmC